MPTPFHILTNDTFVSCQVTVPDEFSGSVVDILNRRKGQMEAMGPAEGSDGQTKLNFCIPTRAMIGVRSALLTATKGTAGAPSCLMALYCLSHFKKVHIFVCLHVVSHLSHVGNISTHCLSLTGLFLNSYRHRVRRLQTLRRSNRGSRKGLSTGV